jgi:iron complex outermembrane receptor protein
VGEFSDSKDPLPQIPPFKGTLGIQYMRNNFNFSVSSEFAAAQNRVDQFEEPTDGYVVFKLGSQYSIYSKSFIHNFSLAFENIFNTEYRNHLSRVKSILPEAGRNLRLSYKMYFHL